MTQAGFSPLSSAVALVTGGSRGIGRAIAFRLAEMGASVAICGRDAKALAATTADLKTRTAGVFSQVADVTRSAEVISLVEAAQQALGQSRSWSTMQASAASDRSKRNPKKNGTKY